MSSYISAFMAFGKRFSLDVKIFGGRSSDLAIVNAIQFESMTLDWTVYVDLCENIVPRLVDLALRSPDPKDRNAARSLELAVDFQEYPEHVLDHLGRFLLAINRDSLDI